MEKWNNQNCYDVIFYSMITSLSIKYLLYLEERYTRKVESAGTEYFKNKFV